MLHNLTYNYPRLKKILRIKISKRSQPLPILTLELISYFTFVLKFLCFSNHFIDNSADRKILIRGFAEQISAVTFAEQYQNACLSAKYSKEAILKPIPT